MTADATTVNMPTQSQSDAGPNRRLPAAPTPGTSPDRCDRYGQAARPALRCPFHLDGRRRSRGRAIHLRLTLGIGYIT
ncbi:hypothetical protein ACIBJD_34525 [Kitasatospora sp. NPDC050467]|uniref:hypothetical protein n=1 Tax=Kitasatospora sp. NPDC050467 TaxID=3364053 RepID=UPI003797D9CF